MGLSAKLTSDEHSAALEAYEAAGSIRDHWQLSNALRGLNIAIPSDDVPRVLDPILHGWEEDTDLSFEVFQRVLQACKAWCSAEAAEEASDQHAWEAHEEQALDTLTSVGLTDWRQDEIRSIFDSRGDDADDAEFLRLLDQDATVGIGRLPGKAHVTVEEPAEADQELTESPPPQHLGARNVLNAVRLSHRSIIPHPRSPLGRHDDRLGDGFNSRASTMYGRPSNVSMFHGSARGRSLRQLSVAQSERTRWGSPKQSLDEGGEGVLSIPVTPGQSAVAMEVVHAESLSTIAHEQSEASVVSRAERQRPQAKYRRGGGHRRARPGSASIPLTWESHERGLQLSTSGALAVRVDDCDAAGDDDASPSAPAASEVGAQCMGRALHGEVTWGVGLTCGDAHEVRVGVCNDDASLAVVYHSYRLGATCGEGRIIVREAPVRVVPVLQSGDVLGFAVNTRTRELMIQLNGTVVFAASSLSLTEWRPYGEILQANVGLEMLLSTQDTKRPPSARPTVGVAPHFQSEQRAKARQRTRLAAADADAASRDPLLLRAKAEELEVMQEDLIASRAFGNTSLGMSDSGEREVALVEPFNNSGDSDSMVTWWTRSHGVVKANKLRQTLRYCNLLDEASADGQPMGATLSPPAALRLASLQSSLPVARRRLMKRRAELGSASTSTTRVHVGVLRGKCPYTMPQAASPSPQRGLSVIDTRGDYLKF